MDGNSIMNLITKDDGLGDELVREINSCSDAMQNLSDHEIHVVAKMNTAWLDLNEACAWLIAYDDGDAVTFAHVGYNRAVYEPLNRAVDHLNTTTLPIPARPPGIRGNPRWPTAGRQRGRIHPRTRHR